MPDAKETLSIQPLDGYPRPIGDALWRMQDSRSRTVEAVQDLPAAAIDYQAPGLQNLIGTLLYHIAAIEMDWLFEEILQQPWDSDIEALFSHPVRDEQGHLARVSGVSLDEHLERLAVTRRCFLDKARSLTLDDYTRLRELPPYDVTPEWVLYHLTRHEDEHRGEIHTIRTLYEASQRDG
jgi:uncharacterized damage-inducible protein DinB